MGNTSRGELLPVSTAPAIKILKVQQKCSKFRTPSVERLWQIPFFRLRLRASLVIGSLWLNPNSVTSCFELDIFTITWRATSLDKSFLRNIVGYHVRIITDIFVGLVLSPKFKKIISGRVAFQLKHKTKFTSQITAKACCRWFYEGVLKQLHWKYSEKCMQWCFF